jgi:hypothetical protein
VSAFDEQRLDALRRGAFAADERGNVAIRTADLRWLISLAGDRTEEHEPREIPQEGNE